MQQTSNPKLKATLALIGGVICIGFAPILVKLADASGDVVGFYRFTIASAVLSIPMFIHWRRGNAKLPRGAIIWGVLGGFFFALDIGVWNQSLTFTTASNATILGNTAPLWVGLGSWLIFRESLNRGFWVGLAVALTGAVIIVLAGQGVVIESAPRPTLGNLMAFFVGAAYAGYILVTGRARQEIDNLSYMWFFTTVGAVMLLIASLSLGSQLTGYPPSTYRAIIAMGLVSHVGGWLLINYALGHLRAALVSVSLLGQPILATILGALVLSEFPTVFQLAGGFVTLGGIALVHRSMAGEHEVTQIRKRE